MLVSEIYETTRVHKKLSSVCKITWKASRIGKSIRFILERVFDSAFYSSNYFWRVRGGRRYRSRGYLNPTGYVADCVCKHSLFWNFRPSDLFFFSQLVYTLLYELYMNSISTYIFLVCNKIWIPVLHKRGIYVMIVQMLSCAIQNNMYSSAKLLSKLLSKKGWHSINKYCNLFL